MRVALIQAQLPPIQRCAWQRAARLRSASGYWSKSGAVMDSEPTGKSSAAAPVFWNV